MTIEKRRVVFQEPTVGYLRDFILDKEISDTDSIALHQRMFDELALDFRKIYGEPISQPFIFLGVCIKISDGGVIRFNEAIITFDDPIPDSQLTAEEIMARQKKVREYTIAVIARV